MSPPVIVLDQAEEELRDAEAWYEDQAAGLGGEFRGAIDSAMAEIEARPSLARRVLHVASSVDAREIPVERFPYKVVFLVEAEVTWILAFAHHRRRPGYWRTRAD